jgi:DNA-binding response OmpR family regulator
MRILLVEDEPAMAENVRTALLRQDILMDHAASLDVAEEAILAGVHDAILLDRKLPDGDGISLIPLIRKRHQGVPIIVLSALGTSNDRVAGLEIGADDYLGKPFSVNELLARLRAVLRRSAVLAPDIVRLGNVEFDTASRSVTVAGLALSLPRRQILVLETLIRRAGRTVTRTGLGEAVFNFDDDIASNALESHISRLRKSMADAGATVEIGTVRGVGYVLKLI